jgi:hypothetical protein
MGFPPLDEYRSIIETAFARHALLRTMRDMTRLGFATPTHPGEKAVSKTPMTEYDAGCPFISTLIDSQMRRFMQ